MPLSFEQQIKRIIDNREGVTREIFAASAIQVAEKVITRTPVDEGRARINWNPSINRYDDSTTEEKPGEAAATSRATSRATAEASKLQLGDTFTLVNGLPYIRKLEYGGYGSGPKTTGGFSRQAPRGMVRITVDEFNAALREVIRRVS